jgi:hypothetical protein
MLYKSIGTGNRFAFVADCLFAVDIPVNNWVNLRDLANMLMHALGHGAGHVFTILTMQRVNNNGCQACEGAPMPLGRAG